MNAQKRTTRRADGTVHVAWRVRWLEGDRWLSRSFDLERGAQLLDAELCRRRRLGSLAALDAGTETLDTYVTGTWALTYPTISRKTAALYTKLYDAHIAPTLGPVPLRELTVELIS